MQIFGRGNGAVERDTRDRTFDARPPEKRAVDKVMQTFRDLNELEERKIAEKPSWKPDMQKLAEDVEPAKEPPLVEIKTLIRALTYGEMMELCAAMAAKFPDVEAKDTRDLIIAKLPQILHAMATDVEERA